MNPRQAERPPSRDPVADGDDPHGSRPQAVVLLERLHPAPWSLRRVVWLARRLGAELLISAVVTYDRSFDELDRANLRTAREAVQEVTERLLERGVSATGEVSLARHGNRSLAVSDLADRLEADLVIVLARKGSWFGVFPGSSVAHQLMRSRRRPVLVIPDHEPRRNWRGILLGLVGVESGRA